MTKNRPGGREAADDEIKAALGTSVTLQPLSFELVEPSDGPAHFRAVVQAVEGPDALFELLVFPADLPAEERPEFDEWLASARAGFAVRDPDSLAPSDLELLEGQPDEDGSMDDRTEIIRYELALLEAALEPGTRVFWEALVDPRTHDKLASGKTNHWKSRSPGSKLSGHFFVEEGTISWAANGVSVNTGSTSDKRLGNPDLYVAALKPGINSYFFYGLFRDTTPT